MKTTKWFNVLSITALLFAATSCKKENSVTDEEVDLQTAVASVQGIALEVSATSPGDSIYVINTCERGSRKDSVAFSALPASASTYLTTNYSGYTAKKAFSIKNTAGTVQGYVALIQFNGSPVGLKFDASGNFVAVLEQREGDDLRRGRKHHLGGRFENRDGLHRDTIALSALPALVKTYFTANYATDTLVAAFKIKEGNFVVISKNNGVFATVFSSAGVFINRVQLPAHEGRANAIEESALPATAKAYLTTTYPGYVFNKAFSISANGTIKGYVVVIEANTTRYAVQFDAAGTFVKAKTIR